MLQMVRAAVRDTAKPVVGGSPPLVVGAKTPGQSDYYRGAATTRNAFYAEPDISVNPILAWNHKAQVKDAFLLSCPEKAPPSRRRAAGDACGAACVRSAFPFSHCSTSVMGVPTVRYMEIDITHLGSRSKIAMGVVHGQQAMQWMRSGSHLGTNSGPWEGSLDVRHQFVLRSSTAGPFYRLDSTFSRACALVIASVATRLADYERFTLRRTSGSF